MSENLFKSRLENIIPAKELNFEPTPAFGDYRPYLNHAASHPAKANTKLIEYLVLNYTNEGDTVLDPMAGSGSTGVVSALHNRNAIQVELEPKFYEFMERAREKVEKTPTLTEKGRIINILGDARELSKLLEKVDVCITSPPYAETELSGGNPEKRLERLLNAGYDPKDYLGGRARNAMLRHYDEVDTIITSPPYGDVVSDWKEGPLAGSDKERYGRWKEGTARMHSYTQHLIPTKSVDTVITSPPFGEANRGDGIAKRGYEGKHWKDPSLHLRHDRPLSDNPANIGNLPFGNADILNQPHTDLQILYQRLLSKKGKPTYLSEMLKTYREMYKVLKDGGRAIVIVKPFIKNGKAVDLPYYTYLLMSYCGFALEALHKLRLKNMSFWRILYRKKRQGAPILAHEYILVMKKTGGVTHAVQNS